LLPVLSVPADGCSAITALVVHCALAPLLRLSGTDIVPDRAPGTTPCCWLSLLLLLLLLLLVLLLWGAQPPPALACGAPPAVAAAPARLSLLRMAAPPPLAWCVAGAAPVPLVVAPLVNDMLPALMLCTCWSMAVRLPVNVRTSWLVWSSTYLRGTAMEQ
jgi:hypothetical protein